MWQGYNNQPGYDILEMKNLCPVKECSIHPEALSMLFGTYSFHV